MFFEVEDNCTLEKVKKKIFILILPNLKNILLLLVAFLGKITLQSINLKP